MLLTTFELWLDQYATEDGYSLLQRVLTNWTSFYAAFEMWKTQDSRKLVEGMVAHWLELERLWLSVKDQVDADVQWRPRVEEQQKQILDKLTKFGPTALERLQEEQAKLRAEVFAQLELREQEEEFIENGAISASASANPTAILSTSPSAFPAGRFMRKNTVAPSIALPKTDAAAASNDSVQSLDPFVDPKLPPTPSGERDVQQVVSEFGQQLTNEQLAHELIMDPDFQLKPKKRSPLEEQVRAMAMAAFWDDVRNEFAAGRFEYAGKLVGDAKQVLHD